MVNAFNASDIAGSDIADNLNILNGIVMRIRIAASKNLSYVTATNRGIYRRDNRAAVLVTDHGQTGNIIIVNAEVSDT